MILVPLLKPKFTIAFATRGANFGFGALAANGGEAPTGAAMQQCKD
jgi:hypothetical protein